MPLINAKPARWQGILSTLLAETARTLAFPAGQWILARAALSPALSRFLNLVLAHLPGYKGHVERIEFEFWRPTCRIYGFVLTRDTLEFHPPLLRVDECTLRFHWTNLIHQQAVLEVEVRRPILQLDAGATALDLSFPKSLRQKLRSGFSFLIPRMLIRQGEIHLYNVPGQGLLDLRITDVFLVARNITNSLTLSPTLQATLEGRAQVLDEGRLTLHALIYPFADAPAFDLDFQVRGLHLAALNPLFRTHLGVEVQTGTLDAYSEMAADKNEIKGYVKPLIEHMALGHIRYKNWMASLRAKFIRQITRWLKNKSADRIATRIEFSGEWGNPQINTWKAIGDFLRNAFQAAFRPRLDHSIRFARASPKEAILTIDYRKKAPSPYLRALTLVKKAAVRWSDDNAGRMSAALSYYATFSLAPLLILVIAIAGLAFGRQAAEGHLVDQLSGFIGSQSAVAIQSMIQVAWKPTKGVVASILSILTLLFGSLGVLVELKQALNKIWRSPVDSSLASVITDRLRSLGLILGVGFLLLVSLVVSAGIAAFEHLVGPMLPLSEFFAHALNLGVSFAIITGLFGLIFKWLPDTYVAWRDVWTGAAVTSFLFTVGKQVFGLYLGRASVSSAYGAAGSVVIILLWVYYSAMILYFGAEFTALYAEVYGSRKQ
jgi:membrane protein